MVAGPLHPPRLLRLEPRCGVCQLGPAAEPLFGEINRLCALGWSSGQILRRVGPRLAAMGLRLHPKSISRHRLLHLDRTSFGEATAAPQAMTDQGQLGALLHRLLAHLAELDRLATSADGPDLKIIAGIARTTSAVRALIDAQRRVVASDAGLEVAMRAHTEVLVRSTSRALVDRLERLVGEVDDGAAMALRAACAELPNLMHAAIREAVDQTRGELQSAGTRGPR